MRSRAKCPTRKLDRPRRESFPDRLSCSRFVARQRSTLQPNPGYRISKRDAEFLRRWPIREEFRALPFAAPSIFRRVSPLSVRHLMLLWRVPIPSLEIRRPRWAVRDTRELLSASRDRLL